MTELFQKCIPIILNNEGGYCNDAHDAGGETKFGITKRNYPSIDIKNLTIDQAIQIYFDDYWSLMKMDLIKNEDLALQVFDAGVNMGQHSAIKLLQRLVGAEFDGKIGPHTLSGIKCFPGDIVEEYKKRRKLFYVTLVEKKPDQKVFLKGWLKRVDRTKF
jgi:lysozyme family protein